MRIRNQGRGALQQRYEAAGGREGARCGDAVVLHGGDGCVRQAGHLAGCGG